MYADIQWMNIFVSWKLFPPHLQNYIYPVFSKC